jgi:hypothetical protein
MTPLGPGCRCVTATATSLGEVDLRGVAAVARDDVWAVGSGGAIFQFDGVAWSPAVSPTTRDLNGVWAAKNDDVWAVGDAGTILHFDGTAWAVVPQSATRGDLFGFWAGQIVGEGGTILVPTGDDWVAIPPVTGEDLLDVDGSDWGSIWVAGTRGTVLRWDAATQAWDSLDSGTQETLRAVRSIAPGRAMLAGDDGALCLADDDGWVGCERPFPARALHGLVVNSASWTMAWAIGDAGTLLRGNVRWPPGTDFDWRLGYDWHPVETGLEGALRAAASDREGGFWAVGDGGMVVHVRIDDP